MCLAYQRCALLRTLPAELSELEVKAKDFERYEIGFLYRRCQIWCLWRISLSNHYKEKCKQNFTTLDEASLSDLWQLKKAAES